MATISSIGVGKTYGTINLWDAAWTTGGWIGEIDNGGEMVTNATIGSHATSSTDYIILRCASGKSFKDNTSKATNALTYNASNGEALRSSGGVALTINSSYVTLDGLQIQGSGAGSYGYVLQTAGQVTVNNCIVSTSRSSSLDGFLWGNTGSFDIFANNSVFEVLTGTFFIISNDNNGVYLNFCTLVVKSGVSPGTGVRAAHGGATFGSTCIFGASPITAITGTVSYTTCMTEKASPPTGFTQVTYANQFENNSTAPDWRNKTGADLRGAGTTDASYPNDILGTIRPNPPDIGAWQVAVSAPTGVVGTSRFINQAINRTNYF